MRIHNCASELLTHIYSLPKFMKYVVMGSNHAPIVFILIKVFSFSYRHAILIYILIMCVCNAYDNSLRNISRKICCALKRAQFEWVGVVRQTTAPSSGVLLVLFCCATAIMNHQSMKLDMTIAIFALPEVVISWIVAVPPHCLEDFTNWALP